MSASRSLGEGSASTSASSAGGRELDAGSESARSGTTTSPSISLPKGGGAIRGIGEKFAANPVTGTGSMTVPIPTSPGRSGFGPQLSLSYDSGAGNGPFGFGWSLGLPMITRKTHKGLPRYRDVEQSDVFILSGAEDLVPLLVQDKSGEWVPEDPQLRKRKVGGTTYDTVRYRPRIEGLYARIERWSNTAKPADVFWRSISKDNVTTWYGRDANSRIADPSDPERIFSWLICESHDDKGNVVVYEYAAENDENVDLRRANERNRVRTANRYLKRIRYGNKTPYLPELRETDPWPSLPVDDQWLFEVVLDYGEGHCLEVDPNLSVTEPCRHVRASSLPGLSRDATRRAWSARPDPFSSHLAGFELRTYRRCQRILMFHHIPDLPTGEKGYQGLVRSSEFDFDDMEYGEAVEIDDELAHAGSTRFASFIRSVTQSGYVLDETEAAVVLDGVKYATYLKKSLPPLEFSYSRAAIQDEVLELDSGSLENLPVGIDGTIYQWVDLDGEGLSGILTEQATGWFYKPNLGDGKLESTQPVATKPSLAALSTGRYQLLDLAGDGQLDLVTFGGVTPGFYERTADEEWEPFRAFDQLPNTDWSEPNLRFVDLNGDGHADVLLTEQDVFTWYPSLAEKGFGPAEAVRHPIDEEKGPRLVLSDGTQSVYLADMCGDGLTDLVRIRNGEVCYWPNLGYGRFGAKVAMDNAPWFDHPDLLDQRRIRLADIDGSGTTDIIYLALDGVRVYFNQSGNRLAGPRILLQFPHTDNVCSVMTADLLGNGTACLVWSSPLPADAGRPLRYIDLMGGTKPHLLVGVANNLGAETRVRYAPSTKFYLADKRDGRPWVTRLPFPVHAIERVETYDHISRNRFVTRYAYHHGYFDGVEREFRGFGMVEQWDTEQFATLADDGIPADNVALESHVPPVHTKTWFHTGVFFGRERISRHFEKEYFREPGLTVDTARPLLLDDTIVPPGLTLEEEREACRALKGSMLRQEVYAGDGTSEAEYPYTVTEQNFTIRRLQARGDSCHAVLFTHPRESISFHYERTPADPRIGHALALEVDEHGNVLKSAAIGYGRRQPDPDLSPADQAKQAQILITYTENRVTNAVDAADDHRTPLPCEARTHELTGKTLSPGRARFTFDDILEAGSTAIALCYEQDRTAGRLEKRLIEHVRTYYRRDNLSGCLALGELQSLALPCDSYKLAFTPGLVAGVYGGRVADKMLADEGRYVHTESDANWWIPSGQIFHSPNSADTPTQELAYARQHFFLPHRYRDPFHTSAVSTESLVTYDTYDLLVEETCDALDNRVTVGERNVDPTRPLALRAQDYRVLQPALVMDPNRNRSAVAFDALGLVVGTAVMGKPENAPKVPGDRLTSTFRSDPTQAEIDQFLANPKGPIAATLLDDATSRVVYDLTAYWREPDSAKKPPAVAATLARETHASEPVLAGGLRIQASFSYSDGFGREIQKKIQAEPETPGGPLRWVGSGWTIFNNKGKPVRQYEPFFSDLPPNDRHRFEFGEKIGVSPVLFYDPVERVVATLHPSHAWEKVVFDPWRQETWDVNDTVLAADPKTDADVGDFFGRLSAAEYLPTWHALRTNAAHAEAFALRHPDATNRANETRAARKTEVHAATPTVAHADSLGRTFLTVAHNRFKYSDTSPAAPPVEEFHRTRIILDIENNQREVVDAKDRAVMRYDYDMLGNRVHQASMEAGERWMLNDVAGKPLYAWDGRDHRFRTAYDSLRRPTDSFLSEGGGAEMRVSQTLYGETHPGYSVPETQNLRGKVVELRDQAGLVFSDDYDFKGNLRESRRRLAQDYKNALDWPWPGTVPLQPEAKTYMSRTRYDALNRPTQLIAPHEAGAKVNVIQPTYNEANLLERVDAWLNRNAEPASWLDPATADLHAVTDIDYDAKGQRTRIGHGMQDGKVIRTSYAYDRETFRLTHLYTRRGVDPLTAQGVLFTDDCDNPEPPPPTIGAPEDPPSVRSCGLQNLHYTYDPAGNITHIRDEAQQTIHFRNQLVEPSAEYTYDAIYRLIEATGREHLGQNGTQTPHSYNDALQIRLPHPNELNSMGRYCECYEYDAVGNIMEMIHRAACPGAVSWRRSYTYNETSQLEAASKSNRLSSTQVGNGIASAPEQYTYDANGNMLHMLHLQVMQWDFKDQLQVTQRQVANTAVADGVANDGERTWYVYDSAGQRVRKVTEAAAGHIKEERIYLGGFEVYRKNGVNPIVRETLHIMDDTKRIALIETRTQGNDPGPQQLIRYQFGNHLGSAILELDDQAQIISYEEYTPYGSTSYQAVRSQTETPRRYRYTGKERDEESGFYYHGARYYAPWLGRWIATDPGGVRDGLDLYRYCSCDPVRMRDEDGMEGRDPAPDEVRKLRVCRIADPDVQRRPANTQAPKKGERYSIAPHGEHPPQSQREGGKNIQGHHPIQNKWAEENVAGYRGDTAPSQLLETGTGEEHTTISNEQRARRPEGGDWGNKSFGEARAQAVDQYNKAGLLTDEKQGAKAILESDAHLFGLGDEVKVDPTTGQKTVVKNAKFGEQLAEAEARIAAREAAMKGGETLLKKLGTKAMKVVPFVGIGAGLYSAKAEAAQGNYGTAALEGIGMVPVVGDVVDAARLGVAAGEAGSELLGIDKVAAEHGERFQKAAEFVGLGKDASTVVGATGAALSSITVAPSIALKRTVMGWLQ